MTTSSGKSDCGKKITPPLHYKLSGPLNAMSTFQHLLPKSRIVSKCNNFDPEPKMQSSPQKTLIYSFLWYLEIKTKENLCRKTL